MKGREFKDEVFQQLARVAAAFASPKRIEILDVLAQGERSVEGIARETGLSVANTSRHLQVLKSVRLVAFRRRGVTVLYRLADPIVLEGYTMLRRLAEARLPEVERLVRDYFSSADTMEPVSREWLLERMATGEVVVVDVRPAEEYEAGHIAGAVSLPLDELETRLRSLPPSKEVVAYCRGPYCVLAAEAVRRLRKAGVRAVRLADGFPDWRDAGLPIATGREVSS